jgi:UDPglucose--hexose-1-phosphate uridylyltransferase
MNLEALARRYRQLKRQSSVNYIQIIKNYGAAGGASLVHPHHQIFTTPVLPNDVHDMLHGAERYAKKHGQDVFSTLLEYERAEGTRIISQNEGFVALCPFASRVPFEVWIVPRQADPFFDDLNVKERRLLAAAFHDIIRRLYVGLNDPSYNYVIHSAPCDDTGFVCDTSVFAHYRWHVQIFPRLTTWGGFEYGTGLEINTVLPEEAAEYLRGVDTSALEEVS